MSPCTHPQFLFHFLFFCSREKTERLKKMHRLLFTLISVIWRNIGSFMCTFGRLLGQKLANRITVRGSLSINLQPLNAEHILYLGGKIALFSGFNLRKMAQKVAFRDGYLGGLMTSSWRHIGEFYFLIQAGEILWYSHSKNYKAPLIFEKKRGATSGTTFNNLINNGIWEAFERPRFCACPSYLQVWRSSDERKNLSWCL